MGKWIFCCEYGNLEKVYCCSKCGSTITADKMNGEKYCHNCGERMDGESDKKRIFASLQMNLLEKRQKPKTEQNSTKDMPMI